MSPLFWFGFSSGCFAATAGAAAIAAWRSWRLVQTFTVVPRVTAGEPATAVDPHEPPHLELHYTGSH